MKFSETFKVFQLNILRQSGIMVTPEQVGLKRDPIAELQAKNAATPFSAVLGRMGSMPGLGQLPAPPVLPADTSDAEAMAKYQKDLLAYQNNFQLYNQRFMQLMLQQMQAMHQSMQTGQRQGGNSVAERPIGIGGILGGASDA